MRSARKPLRFEYLEDRSLLAAAVTLSEAGVLSIVGTTAADSAHASVVGSEIVIEHFTRGDSAHTFDRFSAVYVGSLFFNGLGGADEFVNETAIAATALGSDGSDTLIGGSGNDRLSGGPNNDVLAGGSGDDRLYGDIGNDRLTGDDGSDFLDAGSAREAADGGAGVDFNAYRTAINGALYTDVVQGGGPVCWIAASISAVARAGVDLSQRITYEGSNRFRVDLFNFDDPDNRLSSSMSRVIEYVNFDGTVVGADAETNPDPAQEDEYWVLIMQRAIIQAVSRWDPSQNIENPHSGGAADPMSIIVGESAQWGDSDTLSTIENWLRDGYALVAATDTTTEPRLESGHAYTVVRVQRDVDGSPFVFVRNPWGYAGGDGGVATDADPSDGLLLLSWDEFRDGFSGIGYVVADTTHADRFDMLLDMNAQPDGNDGTGGIDSTFDRIVVSPNRGNIDIHVNGVLADSLPRGNVTSIVVYGSSDADEIVVDAGLNLPVRVAGGGGFTDQLTVRGSNRGDVISFDQEVWGDYDGRGVVDGMTRAGRTTIRDRDIEVLGLDALGGADLIGVGVVGPAVLIVDVDCGSGRDVLTVLPMATVPIHATGGNGHDWLRGGSADDTMSGGSGNDTVEGGDGVDWLMGGDNNDVLDGGPGYDLVYGDDGNDRLRTNDRDFLDGGNDSDSYEVQFASGAEHGDLMAGIQDIGSDGTDRLVVLGTEGIDQVRIVGSQLTRFLGWTFGGYPYFGYREVYHTVDFYGIENLRVCTLGEADEINVEGTAPVTPVVVQSGDGDDTINVFAAGILSHLQVQGGTSSDTLIVDDTADSTADQVTVTATRIGGGRGDTFFDPGIWLDYDGIERVELHLGEASDTIRLTPSAKTEFFVDGNNPVTPADPAEGDYLQLNIAGAAGRHYLPGSAPSTGTWTFTNRRPVSFESIERLLPDVPTSGK